MLSTACGGVDGGGSGRLLLVGGGVVPTATAAGKAGAPILTLAPRRIGA